MKLSCAGLVPFLLLAGAAAADEARWSRRVEVSAPGPVVVELDGRAAERAAIDLEVIGPDGRAVRAALRAERAGARPVRVTGVRASGPGGWQVELDAGAGAPRHDALRFALAGDTVAEGVLLEGGDGPESGAAWRELARGDLFRLGSGESLQDFVLSYEPTEVRWLRLSWPRGAGLPELAEVSILPAAERGGEERKVETECGAGPSGTSGPSEGPRHLDCLARVPSWCRSLDLTLAQRESPLGFRLWRTERGAWLPLGAGERRRQGSLRLETPGGGVYRFRLEGPEAPELLAASCEERRSQLHFTAGAAGVYQLTYGRLTAPLERMGCETCDAAPPSGVLLPLGAEAEGAAPDWPKAALPGPRLEARDLEGQSGRSWPVETEAQAGQLVFLRLPEESLSGAGRAPEGLRLDARGDQVPFLAEIAPLPRALFTGQAPAPAGKSAGRSRIQLRFPATSGEAQLQLFARGPFERRLRFFQREPVPGRSGELEIAPALTWLCPASLVLDCELRATLHLQPRPSSAGPRVAGELGELFIELEDGDNPPLPAVGAELWTRWPGLYYVHPGMPVVLREGLGLAAPRYDFASLGPLLLREEAVEAVARPASPGGGPVEAPRWLLPLAVGLAALVLLAVLARVIRKEPA